MFEIAPLTAWHATYVAIFLPPSRASLLVIADAPAPAPAVRTPVAPPIATLVAKDFPLNSC